MRGRLLFVFVGAVILTFLLGRYVPELVYLLPTTENGDVTNSVTFLLLGIPIALVGLHAMCIRPKKFKH